MLEVTRKIASLSQMIKGSPVQWRPFYNSTVKPESSYRQNLEIPPLSGTRSCLLSCGRRRKKTKTKRVDLSDPRRRKGITGTASGANREKEKVDYYLSFIVLLAGNTSRTHP